MRGQLLHWPKKYTLNNLRNERRNSIWCVASASSLRIQVGVNMEYITLNRDRMAANMDLFDFVLPKEDIAQIEQLDQNRTLFGWY